VLHWIRTLDKQETKMTLHSNCMGNRIDMVGLVSEWLLVGGTGDEVDRSHGSRLRQVLQFTADV